MKCFIVFIFLASCASKNPDWDSGAQKQLNYTDEQKQEQVEITRDQFTSPGR